jgi:hypothetical protein
VRHVAVGTIVGVKEINSLFETTFFMTSCLNSNNVYSLIWYVGSGALRHMTYDKSLFNMIQDLE